MTAKYRGKIFLISNMWPDPDSPGYGSFVKNLADGFEHNGFEISQKALIVGRPTSKLKKLKTYSKFYWQIIKGFVFGNYDAIYLHFPNQTIPLLKFLYAFRQPKIIVNYHGEDLLYASSGYQKILGQLTDKFISKYARKLVVPSIFFKKIVEERNIIDSNRVVVSPSGGVSEEIFYPSGTSSATAVFSQENPIRIGYVGRLEPEKGIQVFLKSLSELKLSGFPFKATIVGYGSSEQEVIDFIKNGNNDDSIIFLGAKPQENLGDVYRNLDLLIFPSLARESLGLTGIEAMSCGIPVIGTDIGGIATYLKDGYNGFLVSPDNPSEIAEKIIRYAKTSPSVKKEIRENCLSTSLKYQNSYVCNQLSIELDTVIEN